MKLASFFFMEYYFYLKEQLTDKLINQAWGLTNIFLKMKEINLLLQGKQVFVTDIKFELSSVS